MTAPLPCSYLKGQYERKVFTYLNGPSADGMNTVLTLGGFRRSQNIIYRPVCEGCKSCISVRIRAAEFKPDNTMKRVYRSNANIATQAIASQATLEQYKLFCAYLDHRHADGGMAGMTMSDYTMMVSDGPVTTLLIEYRFAGPDKKTGKGSY